MSNPMNVNNVKVDLITSEYRELFRYALKAGVSLPPNLVLGSDPVGVDNYNSLIKSIEPATLRSIEFVTNNIMVNETTHWYHIPIFRKWLTITILALVILITVSLSPQVNQENQVAGLLSSSGLVLLLNLLFICAAALLGVMFFILKSLNSKIKNYTLLPVDIIEMDVTVVIGVVAGFVVSELFTFTGATLSDNIEMHKMTLALLGGFSSDALFSILQGIVSKVKTVLTPGTVSAN